MSKAAELIAGLQTEAQFDSAGSFSLDREKAREKMRQFQLADPHRYVLLLVEAAVLRGATNLVFDIDTDDMRLCFDAALTWEDLQELYASLFVDRSTTQIRARRELALACNAVMALNPRWVRIESVGPGEDGQLRGVSALLRPDAADEITQLETPGHLGHPDGSMPPPWTTIHVKERFRPGLLVRFLNDLGGSIPEEQLIRERCKLSSQTITLDGVRVSGGLPTQLIAGVTIKTEHMHGVAGFASAQWGSKRSAMVVLSNGVELATHTLSDSVAGLWFWVDSSQFRKDVSHADVVRSDPTYQEALVAIGTARDQVLGCLVELWVANRFTDTTIPRVNEVFDLIRDCFIRWGDAQWLVPDSGPLSLVADMPIWRTVDRRWLSPRALVEAADPERGIMYTNQDFNGVTPPGWGPVIHVLGGVAESAAIQRVYTNARSVTDALEREVPWELNRRKWRTRLHPIELPRGTPRHQLVFDQGATRGCVALRPGHLSSIRVVVDGCLLTELELDLGFIGVCAVITGPFEPFRDFTRPRHDLAFATAVLLLLAQLPVLIHQWAREGDGSDVVQRCVFAITRPLFAFEWLVAFGFSEASARQMTASLDRATLMPELGLGGDPNQGQQPTAVAHAIRLVTVDRRRVSLVDIDIERRTRARATGKVLLVDPSAPPSDLLDELLIQADVDERRLLAEAFGQAALHDDTRAYVSELGRRRFLAKPERFAAPPMATWTTRVELPGDRSVGTISGYVGIGSRQVLEWNPNTSRRMKIEVLTEGRALCVVEERSWLPGAEAVLAWARAPCNQDWDGLKSSSKQPLLDAVETGLVQIIMELAQSAGRRRPEDESRRLLWLALLSPFVSAEHGRAWRALRRHHTGDHAAAVAAYFEVMMLSPGVPLAEVRSAITLLLDEDKPPTSQAIAALGDRLYEPRSSATGREFHRQLLECYVLLEAVPMVRLVSGKVMSLASLTAAFERTGEIAYVEDQSLRWDSDERVIVCADDIDHVALIRLFGREQLTEASAWIHERQHQQRFESRGRLAHLRVADRDRLVSVDIKRDKFVGELVIPAWTAGETGIMKITFCHDLRVIEELEIHGGLPVIGIVDDPHAELSADYRSVDPTSARMAALRLMLSEVLSDQLLPALAEGYRAFAEREQELARSWIFSHLRRSSPRGGDMPNRLSEAGRLFARLELFADVDGRACTLEQLSLRNQAQGCLWYVERHPGHDTPAPFPVVLARGPVLAALTELFAKTEDFSERWREHVIGAQRRHAAPDLPPPPITAPEHALIFVELSSDDMQGAVWLPDTHPFNRGVTLGSDGKIVHVQCPVEWLPAQGLVGGPLAVDDRFEHVALAGQQRRYLNAQVIKLYSELLKRHRRELARPDTVDFSNPELARRRAVSVDLLRAAVVNLARARLAGETFDVILGNLERVLIEEPLLRLATGALVSMTVAQRVRPQELAYLKVWDPDVPAFDAAAHAKAVAPAPAPAPASQPRRWFDPPGHKPQPRDEPQAPTSDIQFELSASDLEVMHEALDVPVAEPMPEPEPDHVGLLLERVRAELRLLRERHRIMLGEGLLDCLHAEPGHGRELVTIDDRVIFDTEHPRFVRALEDPDPIWVSFLASVAYTGLNRWLEDVTDEHELEFHAGHAAQLLSTISLES